MVNICHNLAVGIDIGGTNTEYGIVNHRGEILTKGRIRTDTYNHVEPYIDELYENLMPTFESLFEGNNISSRCQSSIRTVLQDTARLKKYAVQSKSIH